MWAHERDTRRIIRPCHAALRPRLKRLHISFDRFN
jgi:hypothetical protein